MKPSFYWAIACVDIGHVHRLGDVEHGATSPPLFRHVPKSCSTCGSPYDTRNVWPYDAKTGKLVSDDELRAAWE